MAGRVTLLPGPTFRHFSFSCSFLTWVLSVCLSVCNRTCLISSNPLLRVGHGFWPLYTVYRGFLNRLYGILQLKYGYSEYHFLWISGIKYTYLFWGGIFGYFGEFFSGILVYHYPPWPTLITWYGRYPFSVKTSQCTKKKSFEGYFSWILFSKNEFFTVTDGLNYIRIPRLQQVQYIISGPTFTFSLFICTFFKLKRLYVCTFMSCAGRPSVLVHLTTARQFQSDINITSHELF